jgi:hypothetical protein
LEEHATAMGIITGPLATEVGVIYFEEGTHFFTLRGGAKFPVYVLLYQPEFKNWAFSYDHKNDRFNLPGQVAKGVESIAQHPVPDSQESIS